jgi:hypothetical protein
MQRRSRRRVGLIALGALGALLGLTGVASADTVVVGGGEVSPSTLPASRFAPVSMRVQIEAQTDDPSGVPDRLSRIVLNFDDDGRITTTGLPTCKPIEIRYATLEHALRECRRARVGRGTATVVIPVGQSHATFDAIVNVFNGPKQGGDPTVLFHAEVEFGYRELLVGRVRDSTAGTDFGRALEVAVPPFQLGARIGSLETTINKRWRHRGKRLSYLSARCADPDRTLNVHGEFELNGTQTQTGDVAQTCSVTR